MLRIDSCVEGPHVDLLIIEDVSSHPDATKTLLEVLQEVLTFTVNKNN